MSRRGGCRDDHTTSREAIPGEEDRPPPHLLVSFSLFFLDPRQLFAPHNVSARLTTTTSRVRFFFGVGLWADPACGGEGHVTCVQYWHTTANTSELSSFVRQYVVYRAKSARLIHIWFGMSAHRGWKKRKPNTANHGSKTEQKKFFKWADFSLEILFLFQHFMMKRKIYMNMWGKEKALIYWKANHLCIRMLWNEKCIQAL